LGLVQLHHRDGRTFPAEIEIVPISNQAEGTGAAILLRDNSENEQNRLHTQQLEQRALLGEVTSIFAHEVRNPINNISTALQLLARNLAQDDPAQERIKNMQDDCHRLTDLMESVLTFSRTGNYVFKPIKTEQLVERLLRRWHPRLARVNIEYHIQAPDDLPEIQADVRSLEQVFTNLISNAVEAMKETGGTLAIKLARETSPSGKDFLQVDISDTGPGIPDEYKERIFEPFFTTNPNGTGLGLSITKQIITAHRGNIKLTSFPGGTVFHVQIPMSQHLEAN
jgi:signal transduction histidine kinase